MSKTVNDLSLSDIDKLSEDEAKDVLAQTISEFRSGLERTVSFLTAKLDEEEQDEKPITADQCVAINTATNAMCFPPGDMAGLLAVAQYELAVLRRAGHYAVPAEA